MRLLLFFLLVFSRLGAQEIIFRPESKEEAFDEICDDIGILDWLKENNYKVALPSNEKFACFYDHSHVLSLEQKEQLKNIFYGEIYDITQYEDKISSYRKIESKIIEALEELKKLPYFSIKQKYDMILSLYGPGGSYLYDSFKGFVFVRISSKDEKTITMVGKISNQRSVIRDVVQTSIHEIVHIGIEESIVKKFDLTHFEKERIVDLICLLYLKIPGYVMQKIENPCLDNFINEKAILELPFAIQGYLNAKKH